MSFECNGRKKKYYKLENVTLHRREMIIEKLCYCNYIAEYCRYNEHLHTTNENL